MPAYSAPPQRVQLRVHTASESTATIGGFRANSGLITWTMPFSMLSLRAGTGFMFCAPCCSMNSQKAI